MVAWKCRTEDSKWTAEKRPAPRFLQVGSTASKAVFYIYIVLRYTTAPIAGHQSSSTESFSNWSSTHDTIGDIRNGQLGAVFGAASRATFSFIIFAFEITRDYNSVLPLMLVAVIADGIAMLFMPNSSIMTEKLARRGLRVHQDYEADALTQVAVGDIMERELPVIPANTKVGAVAERIARRDPALARHEALLILDDAGKLAGIITRGDILRALDKDSSGTMAVQAGSTHLVVTYPNELVSEAAAKMLRFDIGRLPVVERADERKVVGYLGRAGILAARLRRFHDEHVREPGWFTQRSPVAR
jgi:chloride channel protein, CIC family